MSSVSPRGFLVDVAATLSEALCLSASVSYPVVVADWDMPGDEGASLIRAMKLTHTRTSFIVLSGLADIQIPVGGELCDRVTSVLHRPWDIEEVVDALHRGGRLWQARSSHPPPALQSGVPERFLLVEDDDSDAALIEAELSHLLPDCVLRRASHLSAALRELEEGRYSVILSDLALPDARGLDAVLRLQTVAPETPLVVMSGIHDETIALEAVQAGAQDVLVKGRADGRAIIRSIRYAQQRKRAEVDLSRMANFDVLTGLANRAKFNERLDQALARVRRSGGCFAVFYIDLDGFKEVNDRLGHDTGDALLVEVARRLEATSRQSDVLSRLGGDEFAALIEDLAESSDALRAAERLLVALAQPYAAAQGQVAVTASLGVALYPTGGESGPELIRAADQAMYAAKGAGRNTYEVFPGAVGLPDTAGGDLRMELHWAIAHREFELHYQPLVCLGTGALAAAEGLLRWRRGGRRVLPPREFLPLLETSDDICQAGAWAIETACLDLASWRAASLPLQRVSVNVSNRQLQESDFPDMVGQILGRHGIPAGALEIDVSETEMFSLTDRELQVLSQLQRLGVRIAVDDFGTGAGSLSCLYKYPVDTVKVHGSLIGDLDGARRCQLVVSSVVELAHRLGLTVVAEAVETPAQGEFLADIGCDFAQGFHYGRAIPAAQFASLAMTSRARRLASPATERR